MGKWCPHCNVSKGCAIYPNHPQKCQKFRCEWLKGFGENNQCPYYTKIVLDYFTEGVIPKLLQIWEVNGGALHGNFAKETAELMLENGISVCLIHISGKKELIVGDVKLTKKIKELISEQKIKIISRSY
ncbi:MAG: hypothetical protein V1804_00410 [Patescibacteria group bacterium]